MTTRPGSGAPLAALAAAAAVTSCGGAPPEPPPSVVVLSLDTLRADRLGAYGGAGTTPRLDAFAESATRYADCVATAPWTVPSHASMFTGRYPFEHGAHSFLVEGLADNVWPLHPDQVTLAEALRAEGYRTAGFVANAVYLNPRYGLQQGFEDWHVRRDPARELNRRALEWVDEVSRAGRPFLLFVNYMDAHRPYRAHEPGERVPPDEHPALLLDELIERVMVEGEEPGELGERVGALYDRAVARLDAEIGALLDALDERGLLDDAVVVVTSDHGEAFGEHGLVEHSKDVWQELVAVPFLVKAPGQAEGAVVGERATSVDVPGVVARALGGDVGGRLAERFRRAPGAHPVVTENHFSRPGDLVRFGDRFHRTRRAYFSGDAKLVVETRPGGGERVELYDLGSDPGERDDLAEERPEEVARLRAELDAFLAADPYDGERIEPGAIDPALFDAMDELGYGGRPSDAEER